MELTIFLHVILESGFAMFCILAAIYVRLYDRDIHGVTRVLTGGLLVDAVINIADTLAYFFRGDPSRTGFFMVRISNFTVFAGMFALLALGNLLLDRKLEENGGGKDKKPRDAVFALCAAAIVILILSAGFGFLYGFDEQNTYHRGPAYVIIPVLAVAAIAVLAVRTFREREALGKKDFRAFICMWALPVAGAVSQVFLYGISLSNIANSLALLIMLVVTMREEIAGISVRRSFILSAEGIENISADLERFLEGTGTEKQNRIRIRFTIEDALMRIWDRFGSLNMVKVTANVRFSKPSIRIEHEGAAFNPFSRTGSVYGDWSIGLLAAAGLSPSYSYARGKNIIRIPLGRMRVNPVITVLFAILFGIVSGSVALVSLSAADAQFVANELLVPVYDLWNHILYSVSAPAMFIIVMSTMLDTREVSEQGGSAGLITGRYFVISILVGLITFGAARIVSEEAFMAVPVTRHTIAELISKLFSIIPENLLDPFKDFNTAQLILMGIIFAYAVMAVGQQANGIALLINQLNLICTQLAQWIAGLMPLFTIFLTAQLMLEKNAALLLVIFRVLPLALAVSVVVMIAALLIISRRMKTDPRLLLRKLWPSFVQTLKSGQISDTYALAEKCCRKDLGIKKLFTDRVFPLGLVLYMPVSIIGMISFVIYAAFTSGVPITPVWILTAIIFALILLVAAPPIPGVNLLSYVVIIGQLGIGKEYVITALIFDMVFEMFASAANQFMLQLDLLEQADRVGMLDHTILNSGISRG